MNAYLYLFVGLAGLGLTYLFWAQLFVSIAKSVIVASFGPKATEGMKAAQLVMMNSKVRERLAQKLLHTQHIGL